MSPTTFELRVPSELAQLAADALARLRLGPLEGTPDGEFTLRAPLDEYETIWAALEKVHLLRVPLKGDPDFDGGGRLVKASLDAVRTVARRQQPGTREHAEQARISSVHTPLRPPAPARAGRAAGFQTCGSS